MIFLEILGYAVGVPVAMFGFGVMGILPLLLVYCGVPALMKRITGREGKDWTLWWGLAVVPGLLAQAWYAAFVAWKVHAVAGAAVFAAACVGMLTAGIVCDLIYRRVVEAYTDVRISMGVTAVALVSFAAMLGKPEIAESIGEKWGDFFVAALTAMFDQ